MRQQGDKMSYGGMDFREDIQREPAEKESPAVQAYREKIKKVDNILSYSGDFKQGYGEGGSGRIKKMYQFIQRDMEKLIRDEKVTVEPGEMQLLKNVLNEMREVLLNKTITPLVHDLSVELAKLIFNWNSQVAKQGDITLRCQNLENLANNYRTLGEASAVLRALIEKGKRELQYRPPAFELSKHYLRALREDEEP